METATEIPPQPQINGHDSPSCLRISDHDEGLLVELQSLRQSYETLQSKSRVQEEHLLQCQRQRDEALDKNSHLKVVIHEISCERDSLLDRARDFEVSMKEQEDGFAKTIDEELSRREKLENEVEFSRERIEKLQLEVEETKRENGFLLKSLDSVRPVKGCLVKIMECLDDEKVIELVNKEESIIKSESGNESVAANEELTSILRLASEAGSKVNEFKVMKTKEKRELENSVVSLTEENRDVNTLLRVALVEKEAVEKNLNKLKGNTEQKRVALLQIAERGLQRVGFGFMMGSGGIEQPARDSSGASTTSAAANTIASNKSDSSECEEEVVSLASTVERIMKNLRLDITQLRRSLEESRSDTERLQSLAEKQAKEIAENTLYIKELEDRERLLVQNIEELLMEIKDTDAEVIRWREACELEVEAGKNEVEEIDKMVVILKQELEKTKAALDISNGKLKVKEELAAAAMGAQGAAEKSLEIADGRAAGLRERVEELTRLLDEAESSGRRHLKVRHICWPCHLLLKPRV